MNEYEQKQEARRERILARADRLRSEGNARFNSGLERLRAIPFGQPILIGHHSEKRDRNYRRKACNAIDKGIELNKAAAELTARAEAVGTGGISSDDPDAVQKLAEQLDEAKKRQALMVAANKVVRAFWKAGHRACNTDDELKTYFRTMFDAGIKSQSVARKLLEYDFAGRIGFPGFELTNNGANIRRIEARIEHLKRNAKRETKVEEHGSVKLIENAEANRVQLIFPGKPSAEVRAKLKRSGFRWSPTEGAWQRHLSNSAVYWAKELIKEITS